LHDQGASREVAHDEDNLKVLELIADIRKFEIGLFWSRSLFFWGFTAIAITAYGASHTFASKNVQFAVASAGFVCSVVWTLVNRSSKYWQKTWEKKAEEASRQAVGRNLFEEYPTPQFGWFRLIQTFPWWNAHFSVSKLATAFSDFTVLVWIGLGLAATPIELFVPQSYVVPAVTALSVIYVIYIFVVCRPDPPIN
jgi:hypothetical protein